VKGPGELIALRDGAATSATARSRATGRVSIHQAKSAVDWGAQVLSI